MGLSSPTARRHRARAAGPRPEQACAGVERAAPQQVELSERGRTVGLWVPWLVKLLVFVKGKH